MSNGSPSSSSNVALPPATRGPIVGVRGQFRYWVVVIPFDKWEQHLPEGVTYLKGQQEIGAGGYHHWQLCAYTARKKTFNGFKAIWPREAHIEPSTSAAYSDYVWKEDTAVPDTRFELGALPMRRNRLADWCDVLDQAKAGNWNSIPPDVYIRCYANLKKIHVDNLRPVAQTKECYVFWGRTGTGKSRRAWDEASFDAYPKDPATKWWCGYSGQPNVVLDEFRGQIGISHLLRYELHTFTNRWLDRYPCLLESKGSTCVSRVEKVWITSNLSPDEWYPDLDSETKAALNRRFTLIEYFE